MGKASADKLYREVLRSRGYGWKCLLKGLCLGGLLPILAVQVVLGGLCLLAGCLFGMFLPGAPSHETPLMYFLFPLVLSGHHGYLEVLLRYLISSVAIALLLSLGWAAVARSREAYVRRVSLLLGFLCRPLWGMLLPGFPVAWGVYTAIVLPRALPRWGCRRSTPLNGLPGVVLLMGLLMGSGGRPLALLHPWAPYLSQSPRAEREHKELLESLTKDPDVEPNQTGYYMARKDIPDDLKFRIAMRKVAMDTESINLVAECHEKGIGVPRSVENAATWWRRAIARDGSKQAKLALGMALMKKRVEPLSGEDGAELIRSLIWWEPYQTTSLVAALAKEGLARRDGELDDLLRTAQAGGARDVEAGMYAQVFRCQGDPALWVYQCALEELLRRRVVSQPFHPEARH